MVSPSALNVLIIGFSAIIFTFFYRMLAAAFSKSDNPSLASFGDAMAVAL
jgi:hypothetical protein